MVLQLIEPDKKYLPSVYEAIEEYVSEPAKFEVFVVKQMVEATKNDFADYFINLENAKKGIGLKPGYVPNSVYWLVDDNKYIGSFDLRHSLTEALEKIGGHIAYEIRPSARRLGYASKGLILCLKKAKNMGIKQVLVTCNAENEASYGVMHKVMLAYGGYEDTVFEKDELVEKRVWINTGR